MQELNTVNITISITLTSSFCARSLNLSPASGTTQYALASLKLHRKTAWP
jgi:hypothetical protein